MPQDYDDEDELWDAEEGYDDVDYYDDDGVGEVVACPSCGVEVYEDAEQCPSCGDYIVHTAVVGHAWKDRPLWWIALGLLGIVAVITALSLF
jgi:hypothetical protein